MRVIDKILLAALAFLLGITLLVALWVQGTKAPVSLEPALEARLNETSLAQEALQPSQTHVDAGTEPPLETEALAEDPLERIKRLLAPVPAGDLSKTYKIKVFIDKQMVGVYEGDKRLHLFPCCTALEPGGTPAETTSLGHKHLFGYMIDGSYGKYCSAFQPTMYFHSLPSYGNAQESGVRFDEFNNLGHPASHGCIRLQAKDAYWIYTYCKEGTEVSVLEHSAPSDQLPESIDFIKMKEGGPSWDPTNPAKDNPYQIDPSLLLP